MELIKFHLRRLINLSKLNKHRVDVTLTRIHQQPLTMFMFNVFLLTINLPAKIKITFAHRLESLGLLKARESKPTIKGHDNKYSMPSRAVGDRLKILLIVEDSIEQCFRYRVQQKLEQYKELEIDVGWISWREIPEARNKIHFNDVILFYRVPGFPDVCSIIEYADSIKKTVIYDVDDLVFSKNRLEEKFKIKSKQLVSYERKAMIKGAALYKDAIQLCSYGIASTPSLAKEMEKVIGKSNCYVLPNGLDRYLQDYAQQVKPKKEGEYIDIFYGSGTKTHDQDFETITSTLDEIMRKYPTVRLVIVGHLTIPQVLRVYRERIISLPIMPFEAYLSVLALADICIAPLEKGVFADCKSEIKWIEAAVLNIPTIVTSTDTYRKVIENGIDGFLIEAESEWMAVLTKLIENPQFRLKIGQSANAKALRNYALPALSKKLDIITKDVLRRDKDKGRIHSIVTHKKRILFVNTLYPPYHFGGATIIVKNIIDYLITVYPNEYIVDVFTCDASNPMPYQLMEYAYEGVNVSSLSVPTEPNLDSKYKDEQVQQIFREYLKYRQPDLIHFHSVQRLTGSIVETAMDQRVPYMITAHDAWWISEHQFQFDDNKNRVPDLQRNPLVARHNTQDIVSNIERSLYLNNCLTGAVHILAVSDYQASLYERNGVPNVKVNKNGVSVSSPTNYKNEDRKGIRFGYLGGTDAHKGYLFLKEAIKKLKLKNSDLLMVDLLMPEGQQKKEKWGGTDVIIRGPYAYGDIGDFYTSIDVLLAPSMQPESFGLVTREANLYRRWVVASNAGGLAEDVEDGATGYVFPMGDLQRFQAILRDIDGNIDRFRAPAAIEEITSVSTIKQQAESLRCYYNEILGIETQLERVNATAG